MHDGDGRLSMVEQGTYCWAEERAGGARDDQFGGRGGVERFGRVLVYDVLDEGHVGESVSPAGE